MSTYKIPTLLGIWGWFLLAGLCATARAQAPAGSFEEMRKNLKLTAGETIQVTTQDFKIVKGKVSDISDHSIAITVKGTRREIPESTIREIRHRAPDKWWNGALMGLAAGAAIGAAGAAAGCQGDPECGVYAGLILIPTFAGIGAGAGAGIDFAIRKYEPVYAAPGASIKSGFRVSPALSKDSKGVRVAFSF